MVGYFQVQSSAFKPHFETRGKKRWRGAIILSCPSWIENWCNDWVQPFEQFTLSLSTVKALIWTLREMCPYSELFWSSFSRIRTEYEEIPVQMLENADQNNSEYGHFLRSVKKPSMSYWRFIWWWVWFHANCSFSERSSRKALQSILTNDQGSLSGWFQRYNMLWKNFGNRKSVEKGDKYRWRH